MTEPIRVTRLGPEEVAVRLARLDAALTTGAAQIARDEQELIRRGILDAEGNRIKAFVPPIGQYSLHSEREE